MKATITISGIDFECTYTIEPAQPDTYEEPGHPEYIEDLVITHKGTDFTDFLEDRASEIETMLLNLQD